jgi:hypothetical protein
MHWATNSNRPLDFELHLITAMGNGDRSKICYFRDSTQRHTHPRWYGESEDWTRCKITGNNRTSTSRFVRGHYWERKPKRRNGRVRTKRQTIVMNCADKWVVGWQEMKRDEVRTRCEARSNR